MDCSVIIVSWNAREYLRRCLQSIRIHTSDILYEVIVIDNGSHDGTPEMVRTEFPWVQLLPNSVNTGFARANNRGAEIATGKNFCFLNDDTELQENSLQMLVHRVQEDPSIGVLGCHLLYGDGRHQDSVRRFPTIADQWRILLKLHHLFPKSSAIKKYLACDMDYQKEQDVEQVMGACMVMRRDVFFAEQGFDERFFLWFEEVDLQYRIWQKQKLRIVYTPITSIIHHCSVSFAQQLPLWKQSVLIKSMRTYFRLHGRLRDRGWCTILYPVSMFLAGLYEIRIRLFSR